ncbi:S41 family peptidase [Candidatus Curtissbacteria bacterium]|nr:S41 family peptidase [Candidatus Curtissbacteria bacterium]
MPEPEVSEITPPQAPKSSGTLNFVIQFFLIGIVFFALGFAVGQKKIAIEKRGFVPQITFTNQIPAKNQTVDFSLFWDVYEVLPQKFLDKEVFDGQKILYGAIAGMVKSLGDPYTAFLDPKQNRAVSEELAGSYQGVGIQIGFNKEKRLVVIAPLDGTPAEAAGIKAKDLILKIDTRDTFDLTLPEAVDLIRGEAGTKVKLVLLREGEDKPYEKEIERAQINVRSVVVEYRDAKRGKVAVMRVSRFGDKTDSEWDNAVLEVSAQNVSGIILDVRNNPGGLLTSGIHVGSEFIKGTVVGQQTADGKITQFGADHAGKLLSKPLVVLVNGGSASAAEIVAGAIKDNSRAKIIGEKTFGKGSVQDVVPFAGGSSLHVTFAKWLTPRGNSIHNVGITPDIIIEAKDEGDLDTQLEKALEAL